MSNEHKANVVMLSVTPHHDTTVSISDILNPTGAALRRYRLSVARQRVGTGRRNISR